MTKYIDVPLHRADGRTITQRYPARSVGEKREPYDVEWECHQGLGETWAECVDDMRCCEGCGYAVCSCPPEPPDAEPYGCVNRTAESPRECVESGHYWCDLGKKPAEPELRAGWLEIAKIGMHRRFMYSDFTAMLFTDGSASLVDYLYRTVGAYHTLEAACLRAEELAGES